LRTDKEFSMKVLSKYTKVADPETLAQLHQTYGVRYSGDPIPYVRPEGVRDSEENSWKKSARCQGRGLHRQQPIKRIGAKRLV